MFNQKEYTKKYRETHRAQAREYAVQYRKKHPKVRRIWQKAHNEWELLSHIKDRCTNPKNNRYKNYGGRGICCYINRAEDIIATIGRRPKCMSLDRIDNNGHYELDNIRWATWKQQANNRRKRLCLAL